MGVQPCTCSFRFSTSLVIIMRSISCIVLVLVSVLTHTLRSKPSMLSNVVVKPFEILFIWLLQSSSTFQSPISTPRNMTLRLITRTLAFLRATRCSVLPTGTAGASAEDSGPRRSPSLASRTRNTSASPSGASCCKVKIPRGSDQSVWCKNNTLVNPVAVRKL